MCCSHTDSLIKSLVVHMVLSITIMRRVFNKSTLKRSFFYSKKKKKSRIVQVHSQLSQYLTEVANNQSKLYKTTPSNHIARQHLTGSPKKKKKRQNLTKLHPKIMDLEQVLALNVHLTFSKKKNIYRYIYIYTFDFYLFSIYN